jgi:hypothetical protein
MFFSDILFRRQPRTSSVELAESYRLRASQLRGQAIQPENRRRRSLLFVAAYEYEMLADRTIESAEVERAKIVESRIADRRRRIHVVPRSRGSRIQ